MQIKENINPLVSIIVITYNSSKYVIETLESAYNQTYQNIELIISDDSSIDDTIEICERWIDNNRKRFVRSELIKVNKNTGISSNCNRGLAVANGEWVKLIAGDDILCTECISIFMRCSKMHFDSRIFFSDVYLFGTAENSSKNVSVRKWLDSSLNFVETHGDALKQHKELLFENRVCAPSAFLHRDTIMKLGGFDEDIKLMEDYPLWIKATKNGQIIQCVRECLVKYRLSDSSVQGSKYYRASYELFQQKYIFKTLLFYIFLPFIDQLRVNRKDLFLIGMLKVFTLPQRFLFIYQKKIKR